jgi:NAD(P)H dehydrogenase (quinone)
MSYGTSDRQVRDEVALIDAAIGADAAYLVNLSAAGADRTHVDSSNVLQWHTEIDAYLATTGVAATVVHPTTFTDFIVKLAAKFVPSDAWGGLAGAGRATLIDTRDVAAVSAVILTEGRQRHAGKVYDLSGPNSVTMDELAENISAARGDPRRVSRSNPSPAARRAAICRAARTARRYCSRARRPSPATTCTRSSGPPFSI